MKKPVLFSGLDLVSPELPEGFVHLRPGAAGAPLASPGDAANRALARPVAGPPLAASLTPQSRVLIVFDDPLAVVAPPSEHPLRTLLQAALRATSAAGVPRGRVSALGASGLNRALSGPEVAALVGEELANALPIRFHDAEAYRSHRTFDSVRLDSQLFEADQVIHLGFRRLGPTTPCAGLLQGLATYSYSASEPLEGRIEELGRLLGEEVPIFSVVAVMSSGLLGPGLEMALAGGGRPMHTWNRLPYAVRRRIASQWRSTSSIRAVYAGPPASAEAAANQRILTELHPHQTAVGSLDALVVSVPDVTPFGSGASTNPILAAHLGLVTLASPVAPLLKPRAPVVLLNPLREDFDRRQHLPYVQFYRELLPADEARFGEHEVGWSGRPEYVSAYRNRFSVHGVHPFLRWRELKAARTRLGPVICMGGGTAVAQRLGLEVADDWSDAFGRIVTAAGTDDPQIGLVSGLPTWPRP